MLVLGDELLLVLRDEALNLHRLRDHRRDDAEELHVAIEVAVRLVAQVDAEGADGTAVQQDRHADEAQLLARRHRAVQKPRLVAHARHDDRLAALHDAAGDALADAIAHGARDGAGAVGRLDAQIAAVLQERHDPAHRAVVPRQDLQHAMQRGLEVERPRQRLAHFEQRREAARFAAGGVAGRGDGRRADAQRHGRRPLSRGCRRVVIDGFVGPVD